MRRPPDLELLLSASRSFYALVDLKPDERARELRSLSAHEPAVHEVLVRWLESGGTGGGRAIDRLDRADVSIAGSTLAAGSLVGPYRLGRLLGSGGFAEVFEAHREDEPVGRVAVKIVHAVRSSPSALRHFEREVAVVGSLTNEAFPRLIDVGIFEGERPFLVREFVDGSPIDAFVRADGSGLRAKLLLGAGLCDALQHLHERGLVHGDVKPRNVLIEGAGREARVRVIDFDTSMRSFAEAAGAVAPPGSVGFMSPEQAIGGVFDGRSDIFAAGMLLRGLVTEAELADPLVGEELGRLLGRATESDASERLDSAAAMADELRGFAGRLGENPGTRSPG